MGMFSNFCLWLTPKAILLVLTVHWSSASKQLSGWTPSTSIAPWYWRKKTKFCSWGAGEKKAQWLRELTFSRPGLDFQNLDGGSQLLVTLVLRNLASLGHLGTAYTRCTYIHPDKISIHIKLKKKSHCENSSLRSYRAKSVLLLASESEASTGCSSILHCRDLSNVSGGSITENSVGLPGHRFSELMGTLEPSPCALIVPHKAPHLTLEYQFAHENIPFSFYEGPVDNVLKWTDLPQRRFLQAFGELQTIIQAEDNT